MSADQWFGAAIIAGAIVTIAVFRRESRLRREASPVVPLDDLLHEQDSAEAYDDLPDMDTVMAERAAANERTLDHVRDEWVREWNAVFAIDIDGGAR